MYQSSVFPFDPVFPVGLVALGKYSDPGENIREKTGESHEIAYNFVKVLSVTLWKAFLSKSSFCTVFLFPK